MPHVTQLLQAVAFGDPNAAGQLVPLVYDQQEAVFRHGAGQGSPITRFCDENRLTPRKRLALFIPVCQARQHAHQKGGHAPRHQADERTRDAL